MPGGESVGNAYLNVVPKVDGNPKELGDSFGNKFSSGAKSAFSAGAVALGNILSNVITSAASAVGDTFADAFWNYADYEQLIGGVDTLFKEASATVQKNAKEAFKTAGMSANEYMENVTSFSASLIQSLDGDTVKAAAIADKAMVDMSDNANKMGTDMGRITDAYQGFAKQNYTMLDNLKLGYGGTKTEMERLLADASKIAGVKFNIDSYADVIEAIHVMQESMDIAGTTIEEGSTTISGSINQLKGAWTNFLTALGDGGQTINLDQTISDLMDSLGAVASNVIPALQRMAGSIASKLPDIIKSAFSGLKGLVSDAITAAFGESAANAFNSAVAILEGNANSAAAELGNAFKEAIPVLVDFASTVQEIFGEVSKLISDASARIAETFGDTWPTIKDDVIGAMELINDIVKTVWPEIRSLITFTLDDIAKKFQIVWPTLATLVGAAIRNIKAAVSTIKGVANTVKSAFDAVKNAIKEPLDRAREIVSSAMSTIKGIISGTHLQLPHINLPHFHVSGGQAPFGIGGKGSMPSFSVEWYGGGGFANGAQLIGVGERGTELIWPEYSPYFEKYADALASRMGGNGITINLNYDASDDANDMLLDISRGIRQLKSAGAI